MISNMRFNFVLIILNFSFKWILIFQADITQVWHQLKVFFFHITSASFILSLSQTLVSEAQFSMTLQVFD